MAGYFRDNGAVAQLYEIPETASTIRFWARDLRRERTGIHGIVGIDHGRVTLAWDAFNVERHPDRTRLANAAHGYLPPLDKKAWPETHMKHALDLFCAGLWAEHVRSLCGEVMEGDPDVGPPKQLIGPYLIEAGSTFLFSPPGKGKSYMALAMAVSLDAGSRRVWPVSEAQRVLFINLERSRESLRYRLAAVNRALGLDARRPLLFVNARGRGLGDITDGLAQTIHQHEVQAVFLDSISRTSVGDLLDASTANRVVDTLNGLCPTWMALAHTPRSDDTHIFGSVHFEAGEDVGVKLIAQPGEGVTGIGLDVTKANDMARPPLGVYALVWGSDGLEDIRRAGHSEFPELVADRKPSLVEMAREYLLLVGRADAATIANEIDFGRTQVSRVLSRAADFGKQKNGSRVLFYVKAEAEG